ncbi:hypothetical protein EDD80_1041 [Anseongella ginsenosidimutans]|uniref:Uncharacterized protein n=1 Tax=Anseongella ginsenosidimutans TaxID=496056 RepID=A0A4R3KRL3_9SPHI|nr:hypothetical protein [Anseongella ginsenosidimutans]QEC53039.1 hypothetical protein FRZ59_12310 [Anseongella ginsenosidimutans]TCS87654.1 hypothetical protein EDD80_1041 [Anseongella ginsenosidimutans]
MNILKAFSIVLCLSQCEVAMDREDDPLYVVNQSGQSVRVYVNNDENYSALYPDTSISDFEERLSAEIIANNREVVIPGSEASWKSTFEVSVPHDTVSLFIFHADTLTKFPWQTIREDYKILRRYDLSLEDLITLEFKVPYPPSPKMKNMKMFPPTAK